MAKRAFDLVIALTALALLGPLFVIVACAIYLSDGLPIWYRQERIGRQGQPFRICKFRSMVANADKIGSFATAQDDPRVTRVGRFLRRTSIDELPQLLNVIAGDMSLVGPRPDVPAQVSLYTDAEFATRHSVRPGITGLAQATLRSDATAEQRKALDLKYVEHAYFCNDLWILMLTMRQLLVKGGN